MSSLVKSASVNILQHWWSDCRKVMPNFLTEAAWGEGTCALVFMVI